MINYVTPGYATAVFVSAGAVERGCDRVQGRTFAELLIDCEEDLTLRPAIVGMLRDGYQNA